MTTEETEQLRKALVGLERELKDSLALSEEGAKPVDLDKPIGRLSRMDEMQQQKMVQASRASQELRLQQVRAALSRIADDEYGECGICGEEIPLARLQARPESRFCVGCQSSRER